jgi:hypothetical protein
MAKSSEPVVLELATLPRAQVGPFLLLGLDKSADKNEITEHWAERIKLARRQLLKVPLEDVNWAREMLNDVDKRIRADAGSLNSDTIDGTLAALGRRYGSEGSGRQWQPLDSEKALADYAPAAEVPDANAVRDGLLVPPVPEDLPALPALLERLVQQPLDPWALDLPRAAGPASSLAPQEALA